MKFLCLGWKKFQVQDFLFLNVEQSDKNRGLLNLVNLVKFGLQVDSYIIFEICSKCLHFYVGAKKSFFLKWSEIFCCWNFGIFSRFKQRWPLKKCSIGNATTSTYQIWKRSSLLWSPDGCVLKNSRSLFCFQHCNREAP